MRTQAWTRLLALALFGWLRLGAVCAEDAPPLKGPPAEKTAPKKAPAKKKGGPSTEPGPNDVLLELEDFRLTDVEAVEAADASKGKCVKFTKESSRAETGVNLPKGQYKVEVYMKVQNLQHDCIYLNIGNKEQIKVFPSHAKLPQTEFTRVPVDEEPKKPLVVEAEGGAPVRVVFLPRETDMLVDRVIFRKQAEEAKKQ
jgi:hypothetical protein